VSSQELEPSEVAAILARKARGDATVVRKLSADSEVDDESIGFHAQQAVEKWLKAVVASRGEEFEYTHDLRRLVALARLDPSDAPPFDIQRAVALTEYAVPLRYEDLLDAEPLDRPATVALLGEVERWADAELPRSEEG
jgi:HEPN domain-containing protein